VAFANTTIAVLIWFLTIPFGRMLDRRAPKGAESLLG
jgi:hypothetical protein